MARREGTQTPGVPAARAAVGGHRQACAGDGVQAKTFRSGSDVLETLSEPLETQGNWTGFAPRRGQRRMFE